MKAQIIKIISNQYTVMDEFKNKYRCIAMGKLRLDRAPLVGDKVEVIKYQSDYCIEKIYSRNNELIRPAIANIDQAIIVMSAVDPDFSTVLVDRIMFLIQLAHINPIICVTKLDLVDNDHIVYTYIEDYENSGYRVLCCQKDVADKRIEGILSGKITVLTGQSGAGKSTLINSIDPSFNLITQEISKALGRGKHTTRHTELHEVASGLVADTPGFSSLDYSSVDKIELSRIINEFKPYIGLCKFRNCLHLNEPGCSVKMAVNENKISKIRYKNYVDCLELIEKETKK
ncbi:MAG: ribosome small subunit-dependent GTPase A [Anaerorhabdus sp.]